MGAIWITANDNHIPVSQMSNEHINSVIDCFNGIGNVRIPIDYLGGKDKWIDILSSELLRRLNNRKSKINTLQ